MQEFEARFDKWLEVMGKELRHVKSVCRDEQQAREKLEVGMRRLLPSLCNTDLATMARLDALAWRPSWSSKRTKSSCYERK
jgi:hypothetical protein